MDVFEKNDYAGGRVYGVNLEAYSGGMLMKDVGATIIIKENQYMMHFGKDLLNLEMVNENDMEDKKGMIKTLSSYPGISGIILYAAFCLFTKYNLRICILR